MEALKIGRSRIKTFLLILCAISFVAIGVWMTVSSDTDLYEKGMGVLCIFFFGAAIPLGIKKLVTNEIALLFTDESLSIEPYSSSKSVLPWNEIEGIEEVKIKGAKIILIKMRDPKYWIDMETKPMRKKMMQFNFNRFKTPFNITASGINISHIDLVQTLSTYITNSSNELN